MVSLKDAPEAPSFYLSEGDAKFSFFKSNPTLTEKECQSPESLKKFINHEFSEKTSTSSARSLARTNTVSM